MNRAYNQESSPGISISPTDEGNILLLMRGKSSNGWPFLIQSKLLPREARSLAAMLVSVADEAQGLLS